MTRTQVDPARFRLRAFEADWVQPLLTDPPSSLRSLLLTEAKRWIELGVDVGYFAGETELDDVAREEDRRLVTSVIPPMQTSSINDITDFEQRLMEALDDLTPERREFLELVCFASERDWEGRLDQVRGIARALIGAPAKGSPVVIDNARWSLDGAVSQIADAPQGTPAQWRSGKLETLLEQCAAVPARLAALHEIRDVILASLQREMARADQAFQRGEDPGDTTAANALGTTLFRQGDLDGAEAAYRRADQRGHPAATHNLGVLLEQRGDLQGAEAAYRRADQRGHPAAACNLGVLLKQRGDYPEAAAVWRRAMEHGIAASSSGECLDLAVRSSIAAAAFNLGNLYYERGELLEAEDAWHQADEHGDGAAASNLGVLRKQRGDALAAMAAYRRGDERGHPAAAYNLGVLLEQRGDRQGAEAAYRRADQRGNAPGASSVGALLEERGDVEGAKAAFARAQVCGTPTAEDAPD
jgi:tetratricopeptide (TPR) repeat protein